MSWTPRHTSAPWKRSLPLWDCTSDVLGRPGPWRLHPGSPGVLSADHRGLRLIYRFQGREGEHLDLRGPRVDLDRGHGHLEILWRGRGDGQLVFWVVDEDGGRHAFGPRAMTDGSWQRWALDLRGPARARWDGAEEGDLRFPVRRVGLVLWPGGTDEGSAPSETGEIEIQAIRCGSAVDGAAARLEGALAAHRRLLQSLADLPPTLVGRVSGRLRVVARRLGMLRRALGVAHPEAPTWSHELQHHEDQHRQLRHWLAAFRAQALDPAVTTPRAVALSLHAADASFGPAISTSPCEGTDPTDLDDGSGHRRFARGWAVRGGLASFQVIVHALEEVEAVDLVGPGVSMSVPSPWIQWHPVTEVRVTDLVEDSLEGAPETFTTLPDPLMPSLPFSLQDGDRRLVWVGVHVPVDCRVGTHSLELGLRLDGVVQTRIVLEVEVLDVLLPERPSLSTLMGLDVHAIGRFYGQGPIAGETLERWLDFLAARRIHADPLVGSSNWWHSPEAPRPPSPPTVLRSQRRRFGRVWLARASNRMLLLDDREGSDAEARWLEELPQWAAEADGMGADVQAYLYAYDEPTAELYDRIVPFLAACRRRAPGLRVVLTFFRDDPTSVLEPWVDVWCPHIAWVRRHPQRFEVLQTSRAEVWWYLTDDAPPWPSLRLQASRLHQRVLFWLSFHYRVSGLLYWETCHWHRNVDQRPRWPDSPWWASEIHGGRLRGSGDGSLLYPGPGQRPLGSLRLEALRRGSQDYDLLRLLATRLEQGELSPRAADEARRLLDLSDLIRGVDDFVADPRPYDLRQRAIADLLHRHAQIHHSQGDHHAMRETLDFRQVRARAEGLGEPLSPA